MSIRTQSRSSKHPFLIRDFTAVRGVDWNDCDAVRYATAPILSDLAGNLDLVAAAMRFALETPELMARSESDGFFDRVVLFEDKEHGFSIRLHFLVPKAHDRPHNHRATFATRLLAGEYVQSVYRLPVDIEERTESPPLAAEEVRNLRPISVRTEYSGDSYVLHHSAFHSTIGSSDHASLLIRGPSAKDRLLFLDQMAGSAVWMYGGQFETQSQLAAKKMKSETMRELIDRILAVSHSASRG